MIVFQLLFCDNEKLSIANHKRHLTEKKLFIYFQRHARNNIYRADVLGL